MRSREGTAAAPCVSSSTAVPPSEAEAKPEQSEGPRWSLRCDGCGWIGRVESVSPGESELVKLVSVAQAHRKGCEGAQAGRCSRCPCPSHLPEWRAHPKRHEAARGVVVQCWCGCHEMAGGGSDADAEGVAHV